MRETRPGEAARLMIKQQTGYKTKKTRSDSGTMDNALKSAAIGGTEAAARGLQNARHAPRTAATRVTRRSRSEPERGERRTGARREAAMPALPLGY